MFCLHGKWSNPSLPLLQQDREKHELEIMAWTKEWERCWRKWWKISGTRKCQLEGWAHLRVEWPPLHRTILALHLRSKCFWPPPDCNSTAYFTLSHCHPCGNSSPPPSPCLTVLWDQKKCRIPVGDWRATIPVGHKHFSGWNSTTSFLLIITLLQCLQSLNTEVVV